MDKVLNRRVLLGVTGGIAAYKVAELARLLIRNNVEVQVAMTEAALCASACLTTSRGYTDVWVSVPRKSSSATITRFCASRHTQ